LFVDKKLFIISFLSLCDLLFYGINLSKNDKYILTNKKKHAILEKIETERNVWVMYQKSVVHYIAKVVIDVLFYLSIVCVVAVPFAAKFLFAWINYGEEWYLPFFAAVIFLSGVGCVYILFNLKQMYRSLLVGDPFVHENVGHFRKMAVVCFAIAVLYILKCIFLFTVAAAVIAVIFVVGCLFCLTLKDLFKQAINFKTENELTI